MLTKTQHPSLSVRGWPKKKNSKCFNFQSTHSSPLLSAEVVGKSLTASLTVRRNWISSSPSAPSAILHSCQRKNLKRKGKQICSQFDDSRVLFHLHHDAGFWGDRMYLQPPLPKLWYEAGGWTVHVYSCSLRHHQEVEQADKTKAATRMVLSPLMLEEVSPEKIKQVREGNEEVGGQIKEEGGWLEWRERRAVIQLWWCIKGAAKTQGRTRFRKK